MLLFVVNLRTLAAYPHILDGYDLLQDAAGQKPRISHIGALKRSGKGMSTGL
jgi:hypothetical protein